MSCHAQGRCHFCSQKHTLTVFGSKKSEHDFMQKANLNLIVLNTVCTSCINVLDGFIKNKITNSTHQVQLTKEENTTSTSKSNTYVQCTQGEIYQNSNSTTVNKVSQIEDTLHKEEYVMSDNVNTSTINEKNKKIRLCSDCDFCHKQFNHTGDLNKHKRKHTKEKPYLCCFCKQQFSLASNLSRHKRIHSGERPFLCEKCQCSFSRKDKFSEHLSSKRCATHNNT